MLSEIEQVLPSEIEKRSFEFITEDLKEMENQQQISLTVQHLENRENLLRSI